VIVVPDTNLVITEECPMQWYLSRRPSFDAYKASVTRIYLGPDRRSVCPPARSPASPIFDRLRRKGAGGAALQAGEEIARKGATRRGTHSVALTKSRDDVVGQA